MMAAYVKQADQVVLILSKAEANALLSLAAYAVDEEAVETRNHSVIEAQRRAFKALEIACEPGSRSGAAIQ